MSANMSMPTSSDIGRSNIARSNIARSGLHWTSGGNALLEGGYEDAFSRRGAFAEDDGNPARGVLIGLLLSAPLWAVIGAVGYWVFR
jgi:hypothetical protein